MDFSRIVFPRTLLCGEDLLFFPTISDRYYSASQAFAHHSLFKHELLIRPKYRRGAPFLQTCKCFSMAEQSSEEHFSDVQLLRDDSTVNGLQFFKHDSLANAPERDRGCQAPEIYDGSQISEVDQEQWAPEVVDAGSNRGSEVNPPKSIDPPAHICGLSRKILQCLLCMGVLLGTIMISVGIGVGVGVTRHPRFVQKESVAGQY